MTQEYSPVTHPEGRRLTVYDVVRQLRREEMGLRAGNGIYVSASLLRVNAARAASRVRGTVRAQCDPRDIGAVKKHLETVSGVLRVSLTTGAKPIRIEVLADDFVSFRDLLAQRIACPQLRQVEFEVELDELVESRSAPPASPVAEAVGETSTALPLQAVAIAAANGTP